MAGDATNSADFAKTQQNQHFKMSGAIGLCLGTMGFAPSWYKGITDCMWSVSHNAPHTDNAFLNPHILCMALWFIAVAVQLSTGGTSFRRTHVISGWVGFIGLLIGMAAATANTLKYDGAQIGAGLYTLLLILGASTCAIMGVVKARQKRFAEHKDFMLMALMYTLDPAIQRLAMWAIRVVAGFASSGSVNADSLLAVSKIPACVINLTIFGFMAVRGNRVNAVTICNIGVICLFFGFVSFEIFMHIGTGEGQAGPVIWGPVLGASVMFVSIITVLVVLHLRGGRTRACQPLCSAA